MITCELFFFFLRNIDSVLILLSIYRSVWDVFSVFHFQCSQMRFCKVITASNFHASVFFAESTVNTDENQNTKRLIWKLLTVTRWNYIFFVCFLFVLQITFLKQQTDKETVFLQALPLSMPLSSSLPLFISNSKRVWANWRHFILRVLFDVKMLKMLNSSRLSHLQSYGRVENIWLLGQEIKARTLKVINNNNNR